MAIIHGRDIHSTPHLIENQTIIDANINDNAAIQWRKINSRNQVRDEDIISLATSKITGALTDGSQTALHSHAGSSSVDQGVVLKIASLRA